MKSLTIQVAQLSQRDRAVGWVSNGQKWKTGTGTGVEISNGRRPRRSSFHTNVIITQFYTKQRSILRRKIYL